MYKIDRTISGFTWIIGLILFMGITAWAQDYPRVEVFGGYSYARIRAGIQVIERENSHGWGVEVSGNFHKYFGVTADFGGHYGSVEAGRLSTDFGIHQFLFGPRVTVRNERVTGFAHLLFGVAHSRFTTAFPIGPPGPAFTFNDFAMGLGGGVDINLNRRLAVRALQLDYVPVHADFGWSHNLRLNTGLVLKF